MKIYVSNPSEINWQFCYSIPGVEQSRQMPIPRMSQAMLAGDFGPDEVREIIAQLERIGSVPHNDARSITSPLALLYRVDSAMTTEQINAAVMVESAVRDEVAADMIEQTGVTALGAMENTLKDHGVNPNAIRATTLEVKQVTDGGQVTEGGQDIQIKVDKRVRTKGIERTGRQKK